MKKKHILFSLAALASCAIASSQNAKSNFAYNDDIGTKRLGIDNGHDTALAGGASSGIGHDPSNAMGDGGHIHNTLRENGGGGSGGFTKDLGGKSDDIGTNLNDKTTGMAAKGAGTTNLTT